MSLLTPIKLNIGQKLRADIAYRRAFFAGAVADEIARKIRELREMRGNMSQVKLAASAGMKQSAVSRIQQAEYVSWTYKTLSRIADALDARLVITLQPIEDAIAEYDAVEIAVTARPDATDYAVAPSMTSVTIKSGPETGKRALSRAKIAGRGTATIGAGLPISQTGFSYAGGNHGS